MYFRKSQIVRCKRTASKEPCHLRLLQGFQLFLVFDVERLAQVIRHEVEERGGRYGYQLIEREIVVPPLSTSGAMKTKANAALLHVRPSFGG